MHGLIVGYEDSAVGDGGDGEERRRRRRRRGGGGDNRLNLKRGYSTQPNL